jgi:hypothetical protein
MLKTEYYNPVCAADVSLLMNESVSNPDGDIQFQQEYVFSPDYSPGQLMLVDLRRISDS